MPATIILGGQILVAFPLVVGNVWRDAVDGGITWLPWANH